MPPPCAAEAVRALDIRRDSAFAQRMSPIGAEPSAPDTEQRAALRRLCGYLDLVAASRVIVAYELHRETEVAWLWLEASALGVDVVLRPIRTVRDLQLPDAGSGTAKGTGTGGAVPSAFLLLAEDSPAICSWLGRATAAGCQVIQLPGDCLLSCPGALSISAATLADRASRLLRLVAGSPRVLLTNTAGTSLALRPSCGWESAVGDRADGRDGELGALRLPTGYITASVADASGTFVADGAVGVNRVANLPRRAGPRPVELVIEAGQVVSVTGDDDYACLLQRAMQRHRISHVSRITIGVNPAADCLSEHDPQLNAVVPQAARIVVAAGDARPYAVASADLTFDLVCMQAQLSAIR